MERLLPLVVALAVAAAGEGEIVMKYGVGEWPEENGNHRAVVEVTSSADAVRVHLPWRRRDATPERKAVWVVSAATRKRVKNVVCPLLTREAGDVVFEPTAGAGTYYVYYLPYKTEGWWAFPSVVYETPKETARADWRAAHGLDEAGLAAGAWKNLPQAKAVELQALTDFHRFDPMEVPVTHDELQQFLRTVGDQPFVLFPEDRRDPIRMTDELPVRWIRRSPRQRRVFAGEALRDEFYTFQVGVFASSGPLHELSARWTDLHAPGGAVIPASALRCFNLGGVDWLGRPFRKTVTVPRGQVQALWFGVQVPPDASPATYEGNMTIAARGMAPQKVRLALTVEGRRIPRHGDDDLWRQARLRWLDSTLGLDNKLFPPYEPVRLHGHTLHVLGRRLRFGPTGLPTRIESLFSPSVDSLEAPPREILAAPVRFVVEEKGGAASGWRSEGVQTRKLGEGAVEWTAVSHGKGFTLTCRARMECDGYVDYRLTLEAAETVDVNDLALVIPVRREVARYMMGMGRKGGVRPKRWDWRWNAAYANNHLWLGDVNAGLQCKLKHVIPHWGLYGLHKVGLYRDWAGTGHGGCTVREEGDAVIMRAFTGPLTVAAGRQLHFNFGLLVTPVKVLDKRHWIWRYFHRAKAAPVEEVASTGATLINLHQGDALNPHINYPFCTADKLADYVRKAHTAALKVKIYYTVRELSNYAAEFWALRSLGDEIFRSGPGFQLADQEHNRGDTKSLPKTGSSWLCEHVRTGYIPAWHQPLGNGRYDAALAQQGLSRWHNYYLEGLNYLLTRIGIDGLYLDGIGYDREIMKRVRKVMQRAKPGALIDFHSGNNFHPRYGMNNVAGQYLELFPCIDSLWFGEGFDYNETPDYYLVEISGIPFGLFGEMLHGGGNPWRGMVYGMTARLGWSGDPRPLWKVWDEFGIERASMRGYWDPACPARTGRKDVLATAYLRDRRMLIAVASWAPEPLKCRLNIDYGAVGLAKETAHLYAPPINAFQPEALFDPDDEIPFPPKRGWLFVVDDAPHPVPTGDATDPLAGRQVLLVDSLGAGRLDAAYIRRLSARPGTGIAVNKGALRVHAAANSIAFVERPLPSPTGAVVCTVNQESDGGATWGPGVALVWSGGRALRLNVRSEGRFGVYGYKKEILAGFASPGEDYDLALVLTDESIRALVGSRGVWQTIAEIPRAAFPGDPVAVRLGKMGIPTSDRDFHLPGPSGECSLRNLRVLGRSE